MFSKTYYYVFSDIMSILRKINHPVYQVFSDNWKFQIIIEYFITVTENSNTLRHVILWDLYNRIFLYYCKFIVRV